MADQKLTLLAALAAASADDILYIVDDPGGTPISKKITVAALLGAIPAALGFSPTNTLDIGTNATTLAPRTVFAGTSFIGPLGSFTTSVLSPLINGSVADNGDITINGTSSATKTTSYVILQETGGNVGIGTTVPGAALGINGRAFIGNGLTDVGGVVSIFGGISGALIQGQSNAAIDGDHLFGVTMSAVTGTVNAFLASMNTTVASAIRLQQNGNGDAVFNSLVLGTGDAQSTYNINGGQAWSAGLDNSDSDSFKIAANAALGINTFVTVLVGGNVGIGTIAPQTILSLPVAGVLSWEASAGVVDLGLSRISAGLIGVGTGAAGSFAGSLKLTDLQPVGNILVAGATAGTSGVGVVAIKNATIPSTSPADLVQLYAEDVAASSELKVRDEAGNITVLSPHNFSGISAGRSEQMAWAFYSERDGRYVNVDMLRLARMVEKLTGEKLVYIGQVKH